jgi:hypothetical protein
MGMLGIAALTPTYEKRESHRRSGVERQPGGKLFPRDGHAGMSGIAALTPTYEVRYPSLEFLN